jgi:hypothetical protein
MVVIKVLSSIIWRLAQTASFLLMRWLAGCSAGHIKWMEDRHIACFRLYFYKLSIVAIQRPLKITVFIS